MSYKCTGDTDTGASVPMSFAEDWTRDLGLKQTEAWRPWTIDGAQVQVQVQVQVQAGVA